MMGFVIHLLKLKTVLKMACSLEAYQQASQCCGRSISDCSNFCISFWNLHIIRQEAGQDISSSLDCVNHWVLSLSCTLVVTF